MKKVIIFTPRQIEMAEEIKQVTGFKSLAEIMRNGLEMYYRSYFPSYKRQLNPEDSSESIDKQAKRKLLAKQAEEKAAMDIKNAPRIKICINDLKGEIVDIEGRGKICKYKIYSTLRDPEEREVPINNVGEYLIDSQFIPTREAVLEDNSDLREIFK